MKKRIVRDVIIALAISAPVLVLSYTLDLFDRFVEWTRRWEEHELDEFIPAAAVLAISLISLFTYRWWESRQELAKAKRAEIALRENVERLTATLDGFRVGILAEDTSQRIVHVNHAFCELFDISAMDSAIEKDSLKVVHSLKRHVVDKEGYLRVIDERLAAGKLSLGNRMVLTDGRVLRFDFIPVDTTDGRAGNLWMYRDVTGGRRAGDGFAGRRD